MPIIHPQAAGIHVGAEEPWGGPAARATPPVQTCSAFPCALYRLADGLTACRLPTIGMASTGVYGRPRLQSRAARGLAVAWGHARHATHGPGRPQTARCDGQGLQRVQRAELFASSLRPPAALGPLRRVGRHRDSVLQMAATPRPQRPTSLAPLPLPLHHVRRALTGVTGRRMRRAMVDGERAPRALALSRDSRMKARQDTMAQALEGEDRAAPGGPRPQPWPLLLAPRRPSRAARRTWRPASTPLRRWSIRRTPPSPPHAAAATAKTCTGLGSAHPAAPPHGRRPPPRAWGTGSHQPPRALRRGPR